LLYVAYFTNGSRFASGSASPYLRSNIRLDIGGRKNTHPLGPLRFVCTPSHMRPAASAAS
jgi:hypothetical protein